MPREEELAERLMERLMSDAAFRAEFRRDPITAARAAGFDGLAEDMLEAASAPLEGLQQRESRSSLAGALMAVAAEAVGVYDLAHGISRHSGVPPEQLRQNLASYTTTPQGGTAAPPPDQYAAGQGGSAAPPPGQDTAPPPARYAAPQDPNAARVQPAITPEDVAAARAQAASAGPQANAASANQQAGSQVVAMPAVSPDQAGSGGDPGDDAPPNPSNPSTPPSDAYLSSGSSSSSGGGSGSTPDQSSSGGSSSSADQADPTAHAAKAAAVDPSQYGMAGGGGPVSPEGVAVLNDKNITLDANGIADIKQGRMDPRILSVLLEESKHHKLTISATTSDHPKNTAGGSISNHWYGRALDISMVDGQPVRPGNQAAHELAIDLAKLPASIRPSEIGSPWPISGPAYFSDAAHQNHIHAAFDAPIGKSWTAPADLASSDSAASTPSTNGGVAASDPVASTPSAPVTNTPSAPAVVTPSDPPSDPNVREDGGSGDTEAEADAESDGTGGVGSGSGDTGDDSEDGPSNVGGDSGGDGSDNEPEENDNTDGGGDPGDNAPPNPSNPSTPPSDAYLSSGSSSDSGSSGGDSNSSDSSGGGDSSGGSGGGGSTGNAADVSGGGATVDGYPGDTASSAKIAAWMATEAKTRGIPPELPVMAALVESNLRNLNYGDADSVGFFQMRLGIWNRGPYSGYPKSPKLQLQWFLDQASAVKKQRIAAGKPMDAAHYGDWIADIERPAAQFRGRYQLRLADARALLG